MAKESAFRLDGDPHSARLETAEARAWTIHLDRPGELGAATSGMSAGSGQAGRGESACQARLFDRLPGPGRFRQSLGRPRDGVAGVLYCPGARIGQRSGPGSDAAIILA